MMGSKKSIVYQGELGSNSHMACKQVYPNHDAIACATFEDCFSMIESSKSELGMIPIENSVAGRVADIHHLLPHSKLNIIGEHFLPIHFNLVAPEGATIADLKTVQSHVMALGQCRKIIRKLGLKPVIGGDTAGSARQIAELGDKTAAALAPSLAAEQYGLTVLAENVEDESYNVTRFLILSPDQEKTKSDNCQYITSFIFRVRNVPSALYKAMGGFATNGVNMTKLESYQLNGKFFATQFYADIEGHTDDKNVQNALEELEFFTAELRILGTYPANPYRNQL